MPVNTVRGQDSSGCDNKLNTSLMTGLEEATTLPMTMIVSALCNPLFQNGNRMIAAGMCTRAQLKDGMEKLHCFVQDYYERQGEESGVVDLATPVKTNQWSMPVRVKGQDKSPSQLATAEIDEFFEKNEVQYLPEMFGHRTLGTTAEDGQPVYKLGPSTKRGVNLFEKEWKSGE